MFIQTQATPNPATVKFLPGQTILESGGTIDFKTLEEATASPLAKRLFMIQSVHGVMLGPDFISITKADDTDWRMLKPMVLAALMEHLSTGQTIIDESALKNDGDNNESDGSGADEDPIVLQIKELIAERVRPAVRMDGGDIVFDRFEDGVVYLRMQGACAGCPSSTMTLKSGIENMLKHYVPEVQAVRPVEDFG